MRHHARQFGQSKYGLSRIYKVLLDLMVIKTVASFTSRPLLWFTLLALPLLVVGTVAIALLDLADGDGDGTPAAADRGHRRHPADAPRSSWSAAVCSAS